MSVSAEQVRYMENAVTMLKTACTSAMTSVSQISAWDFSYDSEGVYFSNETNSKLAAQGVLKQYRLMIDDLGTVDKSRVIAGTSSFEWWDGKAKLIHKQIRDVSASVGEWSLASVLGGALGASLDDAAALVPEKSTLWMLAGIALVMVIAVAVIRVSPAVNAVAAR